MELLAKIVYVKRPLTTFTKRTILDVLHGSQNVYFLDLEMQTLSLMKLSGFAIKFEKLYID